jgi:hypothetical protein
MPSFCHSTSDSETEDEPPPLLLPEEFPGENSPAHGQITAVPSVEALEDRFKALSTELDKIGPVETPRVRFELPKTPLFYWVNVNYVAPDPVHARFIVNKDDQLRRVTDLEAQCTGCKKALLDTAHDILEIDCRHQFHRHCLPNVICRSEGRFVCPVCDPDMLEAFLEQEKADKIAESTAKDVKKWSESVIKPTSSIVKTERDCRKMAEGVLAEIKARGESE